MSASPSKSDIHSSARCCPLKNARFVYPAVCPSEFFCRRVGEIVKKPLRCSDKLPTRSVRCPLYPRKRTCVVQLGMSAMGQKRTFGPHGCNTGQASGRAVVLLKDSQEVAKNYLSSSLARPSRSRSRLLRWRFRSSARSASSIISVTCAANDAMALNGTFDCLSVIFKWTLFLAGELQASLFAFCRERESHKRSGPGALTPDRDLRQRTGQGVSFASAPRCASHSRRIRVMLSRISSLRAL
jgi:hypothetical protein